MTLFSVPLLLLLLLVPFYIVLIQYAFRNTHAPPPPRSAWLTGFLDILSGAYAACALFNIGIFMVGKLKKLTGTVILTATLLIVAKTYVTNDIDCISFTHVSPHYDPWLF